jgi:hypothetical protein
LIEAVLSRARPVLALLTLAIIISVGPILFTEFNLKFTEFNLKRREVNAMGPTISSLVTAIALVGSSFFVAMAANAVPG